MAVRQYIGARYVVKIHENSQNPATADWEPGAYEPLTMVTYQQGSYLSKKPVPSDIGAPPTAPEYWVQTGLYNGQIAHLQEQITALNVAVAHISEDVNLSDRHFLFICDSYDTIGNPTFTERVITALDLTADVRTAAGYGFYRDGVHTWQNYLEDHPVDNPEDITDIIILGGANDTLANAAALTNAINTFDSYIDYTFINLKRVYLGFIAWTYEFSVAGAYSTTERLYLQGALSNHWLYLDNLKYALHSPTLLETSDNRSHPLPGSVGFISDGLIECLTKGNTSREIAGTTTVSPSGVIFSGNNFNIQFITYDNITEVQNGDITLTAVVTVRQTQRQPIGNITAGTNYFTRPHYIPFTGATGANGDFIAGYLICLSETEMHLWLRAGQINTGDTVLIHANECSIPTMML